MKNLTICTGQKVTLLILKVFQVMVIMYKHDLGMSMVVQQAIQHKHTHLLFLHSYNLDDLKFQTQNMMDRLKCTLCYCSLPV